MKAQLSACLPAGRSDSEAKLLAEFTPHHFRINLRYIESGGGLIRRRPARGGATTYAFLRQAGISCLLIKKSCFLSAPLYNILLE
jgi:hypothetical protein